VNKAVNLKQSEKFINQHNNKLNEEKNWLQEIREVEAIENQYAKNYKL